MTQRQVYNFSAGPAVLPVTVLSQVQQELLDYHGSGLSVLTMSHRSEVFFDILHQAKQDLASLLSIPDDYEILFLQGGASLQFTMVALNLVLPSPANKIDCVITGNWSKIAYQQMQKLVNTEVFIAADGEQQFQFLDLPKEESWNIHRDSSFVHFTSNETVNGLQYHELPKSFGANMPPLVCDMSSDLLSRPVNVADFGLIYGGVQKNIGPAGTTVIIVRKDLLQRCPPNVADVLSYQSHIKKQGMYNTPVTFAIYVSGLVLKWLLAKGGLTEMQKINQQKANLLYQTIDNSGGFYSNKIQPAVRSAMNVIFYTPNKTLDDLFVTESTKADLLLLKGYKTMGGMRASIYNAMPFAGVKALSEFMQDFQARHG